jgi:hypothetical protein
MGQRFSMLASVLAFTAVRAWRVVMDSFCSAMVERPGMYHPEAHYMRGPGPRWREKHAQGRNIAV